MSDFKVVSSAGELRMSGAEGTSAAAVFEGGGGMTSPQSPPSLDPASEAQISSPGSSNGGQA